MTEDQAALKAGAKRALVCLDLTNLEDDCDETAIDRLAVSAVTDFGAVAAVCVWPRFVEQAHRLLGHRGVLIATVVNFPSGDDDAGVVADLTEQAVADGADEIDMVIPYRALLEGHEESVIARVKRVRRAAGSRTRVKAILEAGVLGKVELIQRAASLAIEGGADFIKTSTGKAPVNATLRAARAMLEVIRDGDDDCGFKAAGGVKTTQDALNYLELADEIMGEGWAKPGTFRIGASGLLDALLATLRGEREAGPGDGY
ncbi:MAG: deoxyribose-phosphate aldolase [Paracoccaceae bacterium]